MPVQEGALGSLFLHLVRADYPRNGTGDWMNEDMNTGRPVYGPDNRRHWLLDKTLNVSHLLKTIVIAGSLFAYANNMDRRVAVLEEKMQAQTELARQAQTDVRDLARDVKDELRLLRADLMRVVQRQQPGQH